MASARITEISWQGVHSVLRLRRPTAGVVVVIISGSDIGEHGSDPLEELMHDVQAGPFDLFVDARATRASTIDVSSEWARWLTDHRAALLHVEMLTGSSFIQLTAKFVRDYAALGEIMRIYTDPAAFDRVLAERLARGG